MGSKMEFLHGSILTFICASRTCSATAQRETWGLKVHVEKFPKSHDCCLFRWPSHLLLALELTCLFTIAKHVSTKWMLIHQVSLAIKHLHDFCSIWTTTSMCAHEKCRWSLAFFCTEPLAVSSTRSAASSMLCKALSKSDSSKTSMQVTCRLLQWSGTKDHSSLVYSWIEFGSWSINFGDLKGANQKTYANIVFHLYGARNSRQQIYNQVWEAWRWDLSENPGGDCLEGLRKIKANSHPPK